jgi:hypothetical protein
MKKKSFSVILLILFLLILGVFVVSILPKRLPGNQDFVSMMTPIPAPGDELDQHLNARRPVYQAETPEGQILAQALNESWSWAFRSEYKRQQDHAQRSVAVLTLDLDAFCDGLTEELQQAIGEKVAAARLRRDVYDEQGQYRSELIDEAFLQVLERRAGSSAFISENELSFTLQYIDETWQVDENPQLPQKLTLDLDAYAADIKAAAAATLVAQPLHYAIPADTTVVPPAPQENFHTSTDPAEIAAFLDTAEARSLIGERKLHWNPDLDFLPDSEIRLYLDETLLVIQWQEVEERPVGTFAEIILADGSQFRRKVGGDKAGTESMMSTSNFAKSCNAVLALGGDYYLHHQRRCGISVYDGEIFHFYPNSADTCFITADGDMLFAYRGDFKPEERDKAVQYIKDNNIVFSLAFGPVLIDNGEDVTPGWYSWGEIDDTYARSAIGMYEPLHYLTVNLNCTNEHYYLATLQDATNALMSRKCVKAYTLDGGQTATTVFNGELVNPVQFGWEKPISDIIYFVSALPQE